MGATGCWLALPPGEATKGWPQFERAVEKELGVTRNAQAVDQVRSALTANNSGGQ
mgnify:CR=1 FL=1